MFLSKSDRNSIFWWEPTTGVIFCYPFQVKICQHCVVYNFSNVHGLGVNNGETLFWPQGKLDFSQKHSWPQRLVWVNTKISRSEEFHFGGSSHMWVKLPHVNVPCTRECPSTHEFTVYGALCTVAVGTHVYIYCPHHHTWVTVYGSCRYTCMRILPPPPHVSTPCTVHRVQCTVYVALCTVAVGTHVCVYCPHHHT